MKAWYAISVLFLCFACFFAGRYSVEKQIEVVKETDTSPALFLSTTPSDCLVGVPPSDCPFNKKCPNITAQAFLKLKNHEYMILCIRGKYINLFRNLIL